MKQSKLVVLTMAAQNSMTLEEKGPTSIFVENIASISSPTKARFNTTNAWVRVSWLIMSNIHISLIKAAHFYIENYLSFFLELF